MTWNYRIGTKVFSYKEKFKDINKKLANRPDQRLFSIIEVYYDKDGKAESYAEINALSDWENLKDLKSTYELIDGAFDKPIINLDNFPNEYDV